KGVGFAQHRVGLADARRGADVDAQPRALLLFQAREQHVGAYLRIGHRSSSARFSSSTLTRGSPRNPSCRPSTCDSTRRRISASAAPRSRATRGTWNSAAAGLTCGSSPDADDVTRSIGTGASGFSRWAASTAAFTASASFLLVGPRFVPPELVASYPFPAADGRPWKYPG